MKVNSINQNRIYCADRGSNSRKTVTLGQNSPNFNGSLSVNFWDAIARGGFAASFTVQDMTGTNFPRTYQALQRNKEITGKNNYKAAAEVAVREFVTGPSMCLIPMAVLALSKKVSGSANEVPLDNIEPFSNLMKDVMKGYSASDFAQNSKDSSKNLKLDFYKRAFELTLNKKTRSNSEVVSNAAEELALMLKQYDDAPKRNIFKQLLNKDLPDKRAKDQILGDIVNKFSDTQKELIGDYSSILKNDMGGTLLKQNKITSLVKDFSNFANDAEKSVIKYVKKEIKEGSHNIRLKDFIEKFKTRRIGSKYITNLLMFASTALFMTKIPKLYTLYTTNPETDVFRENKKGVTSANQ